MATYGWYPVSGSSLLYAWNSTGNWTNPGFWADLASPGFPPTTGTVPGSADTAYILSANISPAIGFPVPSPPYPVDIKVNSTIQPIATLGMAKYESGASATVPVIDITNGALLSVTGAIVDTFTATFPTPIGTHTFTGGGTINLGSAGTRLRWK